MGALRLEALGLRYPGRLAAAVAGIDLDVADGEFVALVGPSGCGKSTILRLIAGLLRPDHGQVVVDGAVLSDPRHVVPPEQRGMGMVFQSFAVWPHLTVFDNVAFGLVLRRVSPAEIRRRVTEMLAAVDLAGYERVYPGQLSGGQQQRVAVARSLVVAPRILLLDEPLSSLDASLRERMRGELKALQRKTGITFVHVTHDQAEAIAIADRIAVMHQGRIEQFGTPQEVYLRPISRLTADVMGAVNLVHGEIIGREAGSTLVRLLARPELVVRVPVEAATGTSSLVTIAIRPEDIAFASGATAGVDARVDEATFLGTLAEHVLAVAGDGPAAPLRLRVRTLGRAFLPVGTAVRVAIDGAHCVLLF
jgi:iron(III) transport system ATP-binding protein